MSAFQIELTDQEAKAYNEETAILLASLPREERLDWLKEHQYSRPISFEREIGGTVYAVNAHFSSDTAEPMEKKVIRILNRNVTH